MIGWIIYRKSENELNIENDHAILRLIEEAQSRYIELRVYHHRNISFHFTSSKITFLYEGFPVPAPDFVLSRRGANTTQECYQLLHALRAAGTILINTPEGIALAQDKLMSGVYLSQKGLPIPRTQSINSSGAIEHCKSNFHFPMILKKPIGKRGSSVMKCHDEELFEDSVHMSGLENGTLLAQEFVKTSYGKDLRVFVIGNKAVACMQRIAKAGGYKSNFSMGGHVESFPLTDLIQDISVKSAQAIGLDIAGVDLLFCDEERFSICEVNSAPGFKGLELATNINVASKIISYACEKLKEKNNHASQETI